MFTGVPFPFAFCLDACRIDQLVQRTRSAAVRDGDAQRLLAAT